METEITHFSSKGVNRHQLRRLLRARRNSLSVQAQRHAAVDLANVLSLNKAFRRARRVALYLANDGELNLALVAKRALALGKACYLPVLRGNSMTFARWRPGDRLLRNRFGIPEPLPRAARVQCHELDMVCVPLVGFDLQGNRLGMGGGFYDRTFAYRVTRPKAKPVLAGIAHECQRLDTVPAQPWDVPLDLVITNKRVIDC